jgi:hypothetical protein
MRLRMPYRRAGTNCITSRSTRSRRCFFALLGQPAGAGSALAARGSSGKGGERMDADRSHSRGCQRHRHATQRKRGSLAMEPGSSRTTPVLTSVIPLSGTHASTHCISILR